MNLTDAVKPTVIAPTLDHIDALVAEHIFHKERRVFNCEHGKEYTTIEITTDSFAEIRRPDGGVDFVNIDRVTRDMRAVWHVVEKLRADGFTFTHDESSSGPAFDMDHTHHDRIWNAEFAPFSDEDERYFIVCAATAPLAICLAALQTAGIVVDASGISSQAVS